MAKVYQEYQKAANRHLKTCIELRNTISKLSEKPEINKKLIKNVTEDLYYLTGYIIECSCCLLIYSNFDKLISKESLVATQTNVYGLSNISFEKPKETTTIQTLLIKNHNHQMESFQNIYKYLPSIPENTPLISGSFIEFERKDCKDLFYKWGAETRYTIHTSLTLTDRKVFSFLEVAEKIYTNINEFVNKPKK